MNTNQEYAGRFTPTNVPCGWKECRSCTIVQPLKEFYQIAAGSRTLNDGTGRFKKITKPQPDCRSCRSEAKKGNR